jgi:putative Mn2+ efflux pump MntP
MIEYHPFRNRDIATLTDKELAELKALTRSDDDLLRAACSLDSFAIVEASRRLRVATNWATIAIGFLTFILIIQGFYELLKR